MKGSLRRTAGWVFIPTLLALGVWVAILEVDPRAYRFVHEYFNERTRPIPWYGGGPIRSFLRTMEIWGEHLAILFVACAIWKLDRQWRGKLLCLLLATVCSVLTVESVKRITGRERPDFSQGETRFRGWSGGKLGGDYHSFPSGHTATAGVYSGVLTAFYPAMRVPFAVMVVGCGSSRVWKERHFVSDCIVGGLFGFWFGYTFPRRARVRSLLGRHADDLPPPGDG